MLVFIQCYFFLCSGMFFLVVVKENKPAEIQKIFSCYGFESCTVMKRRSGPEFLSIMKFWPKTWELTTKATILKQYTFLLLKKEKKGLCLVYCRRWRTVSWTVVMKNFKITINLLEELHSDFIIIFISILCFQIKRSSCELVVCIEFSLHIIFNCKRFQILQSLVNNVFEK